MDVGFDVPHGSKRAVCRVDFEISFPSSRIFAELHCRPAGRAKGTMTCPPQSTGTAYTSYHHRKKTDAETPPFSPSSLHTRKSYVLAAAQEQSAAFVLVDHKPRFVLVSLAEQGSFEAGFVLLFLDVRIVSSVLLAPREREWRRSDFNLDLCQDGAMRNIQAS